MESHKQVNNTGSLKKSGPSIGNQQHMEGVRVDEIRPPGVKTGKSQGFVLRYTSLEVQVEKNRSLKDTKKK